MNHGGRGGKGRQQGGAESQTVLDKQPLSEEGENGAFGVENTEDEGKEPTLSDLAAILRAQMGQQEARDEKQMEATTRQEQRFKTLQHQLQMLQLEVQARTSPLSEAPPTDSDQDLEAFPHNRPHSQTRMDPTVVIDSTTTAAGQDHPHHVPRLEKFTDDDDIEHFLIAFEHIALACRWQKPD